jgi:hypothetical protein
MASSTTFASVGAFIDGMRHRTGAASAAAAASSDSCTLSRVEALPTCLLEDVLRKHDLVRGMCVQADVHTLAKYMYAIYDAKEGVRADSRSAVGRRRLSEGTTDRARATPPRSNPSDDKDDDAASDPSDLLWSELEDALEPGSKRLCVGERVPAPTTASCDPSECPHRRVVIDSHAGEHVCCECGSVLRRTFTTCYADTERTQPWDLRNEETTRGAALRSVAQHVLTVAGLSCDQASVERIVDAVRGLPQGSPLIHVLAAVLCEQIHLPRTDNVTRCMRRGTPLPPAELVLPSGGEFACSTCEKRWATRKDVRFCCRSGRSRTICG